METIREAESDELVLRCFSVMHELRPHVGREDFLARIRRQMAGGYRIAFLEMDGEVRAVAGFRFAEMLAWGKTMYVDDLVTAEASRGTGCGSRLFDWLVEKARAHGCEEFHLDSGVHRFAAHRFYLHKGMDITSHHFAMKLRS
jgi:GNAT superfamily N-acetyltransferase